MYILHYDSIKQFECIFFIFYQAAHYFNIKLVHVPVDEKTRKCNMKVLNNYIIHFEM